MAVIKPFKGIRPPENLVEKVASRPYDVLNSEEARAEAQGNPMSLYHIIKPEIDFEPGTDEHDEKVYNKAFENFNKFRNEGWLVQDDTEKYYVYAQTMNGKTQYGLVVCASVEDYMNERIKKHELTRRDKEEDRMKHVRVNNANIEPVFFAYPHRDELDEIVAEVIKKEPVYDFIAPGDGFGHHFWVIDDEKQIARITAIFEEIPSLYIADGHHRSAAAALVGNEKRLQNPNHTGNEEYNFFMAVCFPDNQLTIIDYNRVVKDLNHLTDEEFLAQLENNFELEPKGTEIISKNFPRAQHLTHPGKRATVAGFGEMKQRSFDPLFQINQILAMFRANMNRLFRRSWNTSKRQSSLQDHVDIFVDYFNEVLRLNVARCKSY
jgi:uncharacterized protein (DUF1015 family)